jgi:hypothetical protein
VDGLIPAVWVGAAVLAVGALVALLVPGKRAEAVSAVAPDAPANCGLTSAAVAA